MQAPSQQTLRQTAKREKRPEQRKSPSIARLRRAEVPEIVYSTELPWQDFAGAWSSAENTLARLEQLLSTSELRPFWICHSDFEEAAAVTGLAGDEVAMEDLVMTDGGAEPSSPTPGWRKARAVLALRRHISRQGPSRVLTCEGILTLQKLMLQAGCRDAGDGLGRRAEGNGQDPIQRWLGIVEFLHSTPPLPAAALALHAWQRMAPLDRHNDEIGLLLASTLLWHWGKTKGLSACLATGLAEGSFKPEAQVPIGIWIRQFCEAVLLAAESGQDRHARLARGAVRARDLLAERRTTSRLPKLLARPWATSQPVWSMRERAGSLIAR